MERNIHIRDLDQILLAEINRFGGEERTRGTEGALEAFRSALCRLVRENPKAFGAEGDPESQQRVVNQLTGSLQTSFLAQTVSDLRHRAGYLLVLGYWVHRAVFTFVVFGLLAAVALPLCAVSLMSTQAWGWLPGVAGIIVSISIATYILARVRK
jgi:hypothetical protein